MNITVFRGDLVLFYMCSYLSSLPYQCLLCLLKVTLPSIVAASTPVTLRGGGADSGGLSAIEDVTSEDSRLDRGLIAKKVSRQMAERKKMEGESGGVV